MGMKSWIRAGLGVLALGAVAASGTLARKGDVEGSGRIPGKEAKDTAMVDADYCVYQAESQMKVGDVFFDYGGNCGPLDPGDYVYIKREDLGIGDLDECPAQLLVTKQQEGGGNLDNQCSAPLQSQELVVSDLGTRAGITLNTRKMNILELGDIL